MNEIPTYWAYLAEHPGVGLMIAAVWHLWVAAALAVICIELHAHNAREEKKEWRDQWRKHDPKD
jgi:hypothetical protein